MEHVYIHIPFCKSICSYCDFCKVIYDKKYIMDYLKALESEIKEYYMGETIKTMYIGGGTPSSLSLNEICELFRVLSVFNLSDDCEFTFECNCEDISEELILLLKDNHVNRISIGVESFDPIKLHFMKRKCDYEEFTYTMNMIRKWGIDNINLDFMYGIPGETMDMFKRDAKRFLKLNPNHISTYSLIIEDNTSVKIDNYHNIDEDTESKMFDYICSKFKRNGLNHYEISNFALNGYESKHNLTYWNNEEYYGFGVGASGYMNGFRYDNTKSLTDYIALKFHLNEALLSKQEIMDYEVMLGLRKIKGINLQEFFDKYEVNMQDVYPIKPLIKSKELIYKNGNVFINPKYIYVMNEILLKLI